LLLGLLVFCLLEFHRGPVLTSRFGVWVEWRGRSC
jgi:hypothetical protein